MTTTVRSKGKRPVSISIRVTKQEADQLEVAAARAAVTRSTYVRVRALGAVIDDAPVAACLARLIRLHHRLDRCDALDDELRTEIRMAVQAVTSAVRNELDA